MQEKIRIPSTKGGLAAVVHRPEKKTDKLAILCPGYLDSKDYAHLVGLAEGLCAQGYTAVRFEATGTWESDGTIADYLTSQYLEDIKNVLEYMLREGEYAQVLLGGHSRGGMVSILYAARDPRVTQVVAIMPSSSASLEKKDPVAWKKDGFRISRRDTPDGAGVREFCVPYSHVIDRNKFDVVADVQKVHTAMLIITGNKDTVVPPESVKNIFDNANEPKKFVMLEGIGHDYRHNAREIKIVNEHIIKELMGMEKIENGK